jgi:uncharacterized protein (TIGR02588 family)
MDASPKVRRLRFSLRTLIIAATIAAFGAYWLRPRYVLAEIDVAPNSLVRLNNDLYLLKFRIHNRSPNSIWFRGMAAKIPCVES